MSYRFAGIDNLTLRILICNWLMNRMEYTEGYSHQYALRESINYWNKDNTNCSFYVQVFDSQFRYSDHTEDYNEHWTAMALKGYFDFRMDIKASHKKGTVDIVLRSDARMLDPTTNSLTVQKTFPDINIHYQYDQRKPVSPLAITRDLADKVAADIWTNVVAPTLPGV